MRGFTSFLKTGRVALTALGLLTAVAATTTVAAPARAAWDNHGGHGRVVERGDHGRGDQGRGDHWRGDHWRSDAWRDHRWGGARPVYYPGHVYYPGYYGYPAPPLYGYPPAGVTFGFNLR